MEARVVGSVKASQEGRELRGTGKRFGLQGREREAKTKKKKKKKKKKKGRRKTWSRKKMERIQNKEEVRIATRTG